MNGSLALQASQYYPNGVHLGYGTVLPPGGKVVFVRSVGQQDGDPPDLAGMLYPTVAAAAVETRASRCDNLVVLPGHVETLSGTDAWSSIAASTRILCQGHGGVRPIFSFGATATDQFKMNDASVIVANGIFTQSASAVDTTLGFDVSAADCAFYGCRFIPSDYGAVAQKITTMIRLSTGANNFRMVGCEVLGGATTAMTDTFLINAAVDNVVVEDCYMEAKLGTAEGLITAAAAATNVRLRRLVLRNMVAASTVALKGHATWTGFVEDVLLQTTQGTVTDMNGTTLPSPTLAAAFNTPGTMTIGRNVVASMPSGKAGVIAAVTLATLP